MGPDSSIGSMIPDMTTMKDTMKLYTQMVVSGTRAANDMKSQLWDKDAEIASLRRRADKGQSLELKFQMQIMALNSEKANRSKEISKRVQEKWEIRHKYDDLKKQTFYLEAEVERLKNYRYWRNIRLYSTALW